jgi:ribose/xylose/arabinose/galactoside ABC-type transport system permease subunit
VIVAAAVAFSTDGFASAANFRAIAISSAITGILAVGLTPLMISGNYLSLAMGVTLICSSMIFLAGLDRGVATALLLAFAFGVVTGLVQGLLIGWLGLNPIIITLAFAACARGVAIWLTDGRAVGPSTDSGGWRQLVEGEIAGLPQNTLVFLVLAGVAGVVMRGTKLGRELYLLGASPASARTAGLNVTMLVGLVFAFAGLCAALAGVLQAAQGSATLGFANSYDVDAVTAVLVGGTAITGGRGGVGRTVLGVVALTVLSDVLLLRGADVETQLFVKGLIIFAVVGLSAWAARRPTAPREGT